MHPYRGADTVAVRTPKRIWKPPAPPATLYHFTCRLWWRFIEREGITRGEVPLAPNRILDYPNLTADPDDGSQGWAGVVGQENVLTDAATGEEVTATTSLNKRAVRITVDVPRGDSRFISWDQLTKEAKSPEWWLKVLHDGNPRHHLWWIYLGVIPPEWFRAVDILDDSEPSEGEAWMIETCASARTSQEAKALLRGSSVSCLP